MEIQFESNGTAEGLIQTMNAVAAESGVNSLMVLSCDDNNLSIEEINKYLKSINIPVFGGIFPAVIKDRNKYNTGSLVIGLPGKVDVAVIDGLSDSESDFVASLDNIDIPEEELKTTLVFLDGFSKRIGSFINSLFTVFGLEINYIGGGAGSLSMQQKPCLFTNNGLLQDCAVVAFLQNRSGVGVSHGWQSVSGPYRVTESDRNVVKTLDWTPAFKTYQEFVSKHSGLDIEKDNFFQIAKAYPFGIARLSTERIVRDPISVVDDQYIACVGEVPEGSFVDILNSDSSSLIAAAKKARQLAIESFRQPAEGDLNLFIDCISRVLFLEDQFQQEIDSVVREGFPLVGVCTIGEIANNGSEYLEFYNKTSVFAILGRE